MFNRLPRYPARREKKNKITFWERGGAAPGWGEIPAAAPPNCTYNRREGEGLTFRGKVRSTVVAGMEPPVLGRFGPTDLMGSDADTARQGDFPGKIFFGD
ncbi:MAG: hypothetical protein A2359_00345 [Candidatus Moranbacteria bacterium RIFOXYB1_FULL_43_19]|nr:MAG: hypothetical protein A2359_00345 [Candidatus Moranbacteria bacterium RIFOXYB1_FULL_43_19]OGI33752.1 MAG: hypothetical protein A2420_04980 [Candidatus Moranbacteria bacterium RIFOXYC1_FULL_44_13]OGI38701.1 MAG: hypothetical protein A2612_00640 [Candidatus Moranbacteria bacterium RIFOXYD1_FULL_44_12]